MPATPSPSDGPDDAPAPPVVPGYRLDRLLGRGGSGEVWRARPRDGGAPVAVKLLVAGDAGRQAREAALLGALDHPHLVRLHEVVHQPRRGGPARVALVLDLLEGGSLAALLARRGRLRPGEVVTARRRSPPRWPARTSRASSTATCPRATSSSPPRAARCSPTSAWRGCSARTPPVR
ncbi:protein kinase [Geodermatophilus sp. SYSU D01180]